MILTRPEAKRIACGRKTQHRFPIERFAPAPQDTIPISYREPAPLTGRLVVLEACRVQILSVTARQLDDATETDAQAEGFSCRNELLAAWGSPRRPIPVWLIRFRLDPAAKPRLLSLRVVAGHQGDYTDNPARALPDEPEAVDEDTLRLLTEDARRRDAQRGEAAQDERHGLSLEQQVRAYERLASLHHIDIRSELRAIHRWRDPSARAKQLEKIRQKVDPIAA